MLRNRLAAILACLLCSCAGDQRHPEPSGAVLELRAQLAQLDALPLPVGADPQVWAGLKAGLRTMLEARLADGKSASKTTVVDRSQTQLTYDESTGTLSWGYNNNGDYNQDGEVNISDLTPLGVHFNKPVPGGDPDSIIAVVDGNGDGLITISDLSPLGRSIGSRVLSYNVYTSLNPADSPTENDAPSTSEPFGTVALAESEGVPTQERRRFSFTVDTPVPLAYYWVRPCDTADGSGAEGTRSTLAGGPPNDEPEAALSACPFSGPAPFDALLSAEASDDDGEIVAYRWDFDGDGTFDLVTDNDAPTAMHTYEVEGLYEVVLEVVDDRGATGRDTASVLVGDSAWGITDVAAPQQSLFISKLIDLGGLPLAFVQAAGGTTTLTRYMGADAAGSSWDAQALDPALTGNTQQQFLRVDGNPAFFTVTEDATNSHVVMYRALDGAGTTWPATPVVIYSSGLTPDSRVLYIGSPGLVHGMPAVTFLHGPDPQSPSDILYCAATAADGSAWGPAHDTGLGPRGIQRISIHGLIEADGHPALVAAWDGGAILPYPGESAYLRASAPDGSTWPVEFAFERAPGAVRGNLTLVDGRPAYAYYEFGGFTVNNFPIVFAHADDAAGTTWTTTPVPDTVRTRGSRLAVIGGVPAFVYVKRDTLYYHAATSAAGTSWLLPEPIDCRPGGFATTELAEIDGAPAVLYSAGSFVAEGPLRYARRP
jgi:hypothetical protein